MRNLTWIAALAVLGAGCEPELTLDGDADTPGDPVDAGPPQFECASMADEAGLLMCDDFGDGDARGWTPEAGTWEVIDGHYVGLGPMEVDTSQCGATRLASSIRDGSAATDLALHVSMSSRQRVDKVIVLRELDPANRIELNLRADPYGDLVVQELVDCAPIFHVEQAQVSIPHGMDERVEVDVELIGNHLVVVVNGEAALDRQISFVNEGPGRQGVAVIDRAETRFDDFWVFER